MAVDGLARVPLFAGLPPEKTAVLEASAQRRSFRRGEIIFHKGDSGSTLYLILEGQVRIVLPSEGGDEAVLAVLDEGDFFGELSLIDEQPRSATVVASDATQTLVLHRDAFLNFLATNPEQSIVLLRALCKRLRETNEFVEDAVFLDVSARLAKKLLELADNYGKPAPEGTIISLRLTQQELATMVGATRESVNKHLRAFRARGIIDVDGHRLVILKREELVRRIY